MRAMFKVFSLCIIVIAASLATSYSFADQVDDFYRDLVDRKISENVIVGAYLDAEYTQEDINKIFVSGGDYQDSLLRIAVYRGFSKVVGFLLDEGANPNIVLNRNCSPLGISIMNGEDELIEMLIENGADTRLPVCWPQDGSKPTPIDLSITQYEISDQSRILVMKKHVELGADLNRRVLMYAILNDNKIIAESFVNLMPNYQDDRMIVLSKNRSEVIYNLLLREWSSK